MTDRRVRWGVLSTANIGRAAVIPAIHQSKNGALVAVASRDSTRAQEFAERNKIPRASGSYEALLNDPEIDALYIPLPNSMHKEWTIRALHEGKHVLCEKPLGVSAVECDEIDAAAVSSGVKCMEAFMYRFHPRIDRLFELVDSGTIGPLRSMYSAFTFKLTKPDNIRWQPEFGGGSLMDVGCYCVNVSRTVMRAEPIEVQAVAAWADTGVDERMAGMLRFADGSTAQFDSALSMERRECVEIAGTEGHLEIPAAFLPGTELAIITEHHGRSDVITHTIPGVDEYELMVEHFADCVLNDRPVRYPISEAAANMRTIEALYRSARNKGSPEPVNAA